MIYMIEAKIVCEHGEEATVKYVERDKEGHDINEGFYHCLTLHDAREKLCQLLSQS